MNKSTIQSITYIIAGSLLQLCGAIGDTWPATIVTIIGFIFFFNGLSGLKKGLDATGQSAVGLLILAAIGGIFAAILSLIPIIGMLASILFALVFIIEIVAYLRLKNSRSIGVAGRNGISLLVTAMVLAVLSSIVDLIPFIGGFISGFIAIGAILFTLIGWIRVQEGLLEA